MAAASNRMMLKSVAQASHDAVLEEAVIATDNAGAGTEQKPDYLRTDFSETAFFAPSLLTNSKVKSTLPLPCRNRSRHGVSKPLPTTNG